MYILVYIYIYIYIYIIAICTNLMIYSVNMLLVLYILCGPRLRRLPQAFIWAYPGGAFLCLPHPRPRKFPSRLLSFLFGQNVDLRSPGHGKGMNTDYDVKCAHQMATYFHVHLTHRCIYNYFKDILNTNQQITQTIHYKHMQPMPFIQISFKIHIGSIVLSDSCKMCL